MADINWNHLQILFIRSMRNDQAIVRELYLGLQRTVESFLRGRRVSAEDIAELTQDVMLKIHLNREQYNPDLQLKPWILTIAHRTLIDHWRRLSVTRSLPLDFIDGIAHNENWIESRPDSFLRIKELLGHLGLLKPTDRAILGEFVFEDKSIEDIASDFNLTRSAVKVRIHRMRKMLSGFVVVAIFVFNRGC